MASFLPFDRISPEAACKLSMGMLRRRAMGVAVGLAVALVCSLSAPAQSVMQSSNDVSLNNGIPREVENVTVEQNLGDSVPLNLPLTNSAGRKVKTGHFIDGKKPTIITLNYSDCPMLCSVQLNQLCKSLNKMKLKVGEDFQILTVSIDPNESTRKVLDTKTKYVEQLIDHHPRAAEGWEFCTAQQPIITKIADVLGFKYKYDAKSGEYYHPAMLAFISPDGVITRYSLAVAFEPSDMRKALVESGEGTVGNVVDTLIMWCFSYDPDSNSYTAQAWKMMRLGGAVTILLMLACLTPYWIGQKAIPNGGSDVGFVSDDAGSPPSSSDPGDDADDSTR